MNNLKFSRHTVFIYILHCSFLAMTIYATFSSNAAFRKDMKKKYSCRSTMENSQLSYQHNRINKIDLFLHSNLKKKILTTNHIVCLLLNYWQMIYPFSRFKTIELIFILTPLLPYNVVCNRKNNRKRNYVYAKIFSQFLIYGKSLKAGWKEYFCLMPEQKMKIKNERKEIGKKVYFFVKWILKCMDDCYP